MTSDDSLINRPLLNEAQIKDLIAAIERDHGPPLQSWEDSNRYYRILSRLLGGRRYWDFPSLYVARQTADAIWRSQRHERHEVHFYEMTVPSLTTSQERNETAAKQHKQGEQDEAADFAKPNPNFTAEELRTIRLQEVYDDSDGAFANHARTSYERAHARAFTQNIKTADIRERIKSGSDRRVNANLKALEHYGAIAHERGDAMAFAEWVCESNPQPDPDLGAPPLVPEANKK
jgi:hypothetical protein